MEYGGDRQDLNGCYNTGRHKKYIVGNKFKLPCIAMSHYHKLVSNNERQKIWKINLLMAQITCLASLGPVLLLLPF